MPKPDTKSAALSRLFGNKAGSDGGGERPEEDQAVLERGRAEPEKEPRVKASTAPTKETSATKRRQKRKQTTAKGNSPQKKRKKERLTPKSTAQKPSALPEIAEEEQTEGSGYIGSGRYRRTTGVLERITPYVRPDQAEALRVAVALRNDARGSDISAIIQSLLDEAGYHGEDS